MNKANEIIAQIIIGLIMIAIGSGLVWVILKIWSAL